MPRGVVVGVALAVGAATLVGGVALTVDRPRPAPSSAPSPAVTTVTPAATPKTSPPVTVSPPSPKPKPPALVSVVNQLRVADEETGGYQREEFGSRAPTAEVRKRLLAGERRADGSWYSKWDGRVWRDPSRLDADHTVALAEAWSSGAMHWTYAKRVAFANDLKSPWTLNLITDTLNQGVKADKDPFDWAPEVNRCQYIREWTGVKLAWNLTADWEEKMALHNMAMECDRA